MAAQSPTVANALKIGGGNLATNVTGALRSAVPGRTDHLPISVPAGAYVIPADVVSALGDGNTDAGVKALDNIFAQVVPRGPQAGSQPPVDIAAAGGEYVVPPQAVAAIGGGNVKSGHAVLDKFVEQIRAQNVSKLKGLKGPVGAKK